MCRLLVPTHSAVQGGVKTDATRIIEKLGEKLENKTFKLYFLLLKALRDSWFTTPKSFAPLHVLVTIKEK